MEINGILDLADETYQSLRDLNCPVNHYDVWFVHIIVKKFYEQTQESWNIHNEENDTMPTYRKLVRFLEHKAHSVDQTNKQDDKHPIKGILKEKIRIQIKEKT